MDRSFRVRRNGRVFQFPPLSQASLRFNAHPDGNGTDWEEDVDIDQPHGLDYRYTNHVAKAVRKRSDKEHVYYADDTAGGEHIPGYSQILLQVDDTVDLETAFNNPRDGTEVTWFGPNGIAHSDRCFTTTDDTYAYDVTVDAPRLWCVTGEAGDPTVLLIHPDRQYKGGDVTWRGNHVFLGSVDMTGLNVDGTIDARSVIIDNTAYNDSTAAPYYTHLGVWGLTDLSMTNIDGTLTVLHRAEFAGTDASDSGMAVAGDSTFTNTLQCASVVNLCGSVHAVGLMSFGNQNVYDSSWFDCSASGTYAKTHDLSSDTPPIVNLYFKDTGNGLSLGADTVIQLGTGYSVSDVERGAVVRNVTSTQLTVQAGQSSAAYTLNDSGQIAVCATGQYRVVAMAVHPFDYDSTVLG